MGLSDIKKRITICKLYHCEVFKELIETKQKLRITIECLNSISSCGGNQGEMASRCVDIISR